MVKMKKKEETIIFEMPEWDLNIPKHTLITKRWSKSKKTKNKNQKF